MLDSQFYLINASGRYSRNFKSATGASRPPAGRKKRAKIWFKVERNGFASYFPSFPMASIFFFMISQSPPSSKPIKKTNARVNALSS
jgi:hypothetical protein